MKPPNMPPLPGPPMNGAPPPELPKLTIDDPGSVDTDTVDFTVGRTGDGLMRLVLRFRNQQTGMVLQPIRLSLGASLKGFLEVLSRAVSEAEDPQIETVSVRCPGCGRQVYGDAAERGACFACFPTVEDLTATADPDA